MSKVSFQTLWKLLSQDDPDLASCQQELLHLEKVLKSDKTTKGMTKLLESMAKTCRVQKRRASAKAVRQGWTYIESRTQELATQLTTKESETENVVSPEGDDAEGLPNSSGVYLARLKRQKKDLYKNPPAMPPPNVVVEDEWCPPPTRTKTGSLVFVAGSDKKLATMLKDFHPNLTPEEILRGGAFGGTYFRPIVSAVTNQRYKSQDVLVDTVELEWISGLDKKTMLTSSTYNQHVNRFKAKCGGSLGMWESSGWISNIDPYGWFQWYCRFYRGRRSTDDARQISRFLGVAGPKGRFRSQLCNKIETSKTTADDESVSPVIRQTLCHWGLIVTEAILDEHRKRKR